MIDRNEAITRIRGALHSRSGRTWSVTGGRGTTYGWITIMPPPKRRIGVLGNEIAPDDSVKLARSLDLDEIHHQGVSIPPERRDEYVARAEGRHGREDAPAPPQCQTCRGYVKIEVMDGLAIPIIYATPLAPGLSFCSDHCLLWYFRES